MTELQKVNILPPADQYDFWRRRLAGEIVPIHDGEPQAGFYRLVARDGKSYPVAYWYGATDGKIRCRIGKTDVPEQLAMERWPWASKKPITHEVYKAVVDGAPWPDQHEAVTADQNNAPDDDSFEGLKDRIETLSLAANDLIAAGGAKDQSTADQAAHLADRLAGLRKRADEARAREKKPHDDAGKAVQAKWLPILDVADIYRRLKQVVVTPFLIEEERKQKAAAAAAAAQGVEQPPMERTVKAGAPGTRSTALRKEKVITITDRSKLIAFFANHGEMTDLLMKLARGAVKAGVDVPGIKVEEEKRAA